MVATHDRGDAAAAVMRHHLFESADVVKAPRGRGIASVRDDVHEDSVDPTPRRHVDERVQMSLVAVHAAVGEEADEMERVASAGAAVHRRG